jgi:tetratricopeptide (TPR) repeat protein
MRHALVTSVAAILIALFCAAWASAAQPVQPQSRPQQVKPQSRPQPVQPHPPVGNLQKPSPSNQKPPPQGSIRSYHIYNEYYPILEGPYGYSPYYGGDYYPYYYPYYPYLPPAYIPAEQWFGPQAAMRVFGMDQQFANANVNANVNAEPWRDGKDADMPEPKKSADRATNAQAIALALKFIGYGDALFAQQKYAEANDRYRKASNSAPQLADAWFRQGFALSATGRYDLALGAIKRGLKLNPKWPKSGFEMDELYGPDAMSKTAHLDAMANVAEGKPNDADLLFLIGVHLHFDGQAERAKTFFQRAAQLAGGDDASADHIKAFLKNGK